jgi:hypothetical protein
MLVAEQSITWIRVEKPRFDLVGVVLSSLGMAGICAAIALGLGALLGMVLILRSRRQADDGSLGGRVQLHLGAHPAIGPTA